MLTPDQRLALLSHYVTMEPEIVVNCEPYLISFEEDSNGIVFSAVSRWQQTVDAVFILPKAVWEQCNKGLAICWLYANALTNLEKRIMKGAAYG